MSLYYLQKFLYQLNREPRMQARFGDELPALLDEYELTDEERFRRCVTALRGTDRCARGSMP